MVVLIYFILLFCLLVLLKNRSIAIIMILIQLISLVGMLLINADYPINSLFQVFNVVITIVILTTIIMPWADVKKIKVIYTLNEQKLLRLTKFLIGVSILPFIVFAVVATFVILYVDDINTFKYAEGASIEFYYSLPINTKLLILANYLFNFSYFLIPLHFYYLGKRKFGLSILCLIFSLNIILHGLTYFSRSVFIHYILVYLAFLYMLFSTFDRRFRRLLRISVSIAAVLFATYFIYISNQRFTGDKQYADLIPQKSLIQDPVVYSYFDYLSQWYPNGMKVLDSYNFESFNGQVTMQPVLSILGQYNIISYSSDSYVSLRKRLWPENWWTFNGFVAYTIYDYGYLFSFIILSLYVYAIKKSSPIAGRISVMKLFILVLLIQLPLVAIFYSNAGAIVIPLLFLIPIAFYLKVKIN